MTYEECLNEMYGLRRFGIKLGLDVIECMLSGLNNPHHHFCCIHIAGTNGKGSIASYLAAMLTGAGYRTGLYTSPHLVRFNERICINGTEIADEDVVNAYLAVKAVCHGDREPTFFEYTTAMALYTFAKADVKWAVIETGMGGRLDATNILTPELSIISNISMEHSFYLGNTLADIAGEKGGIIKPNTPVVTGVRQKTATDVLRRIAAERNAPFFRLGEQFRIRRSQTSGTASGASTVFSYYGKNLRLKTLHTSLAGSHQADNAALAVAAAEILSDMGCAVLPENSIRVGLAQAVWPGRLEILPTTPQVIIDGAHNLEAARRLNTFLRDYSAGRPITMVIGILDDKPLAAMLRCFLPLAGHVIFTQPQIDRRLPAMTLYDEALRLFPEKHFSAEITGSVPEAVKKAMETTPPDHLICIAGSLYVAGEARHEFERMHSDAPADRGKMPFIS